MKLKNKEMKERPKHNNYSFRHVHAMTIMAAENKQKFRKYILKSESLMMRGKHHSKI